DTVFGHRENMLNFKTDGPMYSEVGLGVIHGGSGLPNVGPTITTEDFGENGKRFILGVVYTDGNKNKFYDVGEGNSGVTITVSSGSFSAVSSTSGGYAIPVTATGTVTVTAKGGAVGSTPLTQTVTLNGENVKVDFILGGAPSAPHVITPLSDTVLGTTS